MKKLLVIINIFLFIPLCLFAQQQKDYTVYGSMPVGDIMQEIGDITKETDDLVKDMINRTNEIVVLAQKMVENTKTCKDKEECDCICQEEQTDNGCICNSIKCSPNYLCDNIKSQALYNNIENSFKNFQTSKTDFGKILSEHIIVPDHLETLYGGRFTELPKSNLYTDYNEFYLNYNQIISPVLAKMGIVSILPSSTNKIPFIEYIKRESDFARVGFYNCQTPAGQIEDIEDITQGKEDFKYPYRVDFALTSDIYLGTDEKENILNYYCVNINYREFPEN